MPIESLSTTSTVLQYTTGRGPGSPQIIYIRSPRSDSQKGKNTIIWDDTSYTSGTVFVNPVPHYFEVHRLPLPCTSIPLTPPRYLLDLRRVAGHLERSVRAHEWFRAALDIFEVLARGHSLVRRQVLHEGHEVAGETRDLLCRDEGEHSHAAVWSLEQIEVVTSDRNGRDGRPGTRDGPCTTESRKPDHDLVLFAACWRRCREQIVRHVGDERRRVRVRVLHGRLDGRDVLELQWRELQRHVGVRLDVVRSASPRIRRVPGDFGATDRVEAGALTAGRGRAFAPQVVVQNVVSRGSETPLITEVGGRGSSSKESTNHSKQGELHGDLS